MGGSSRNPAGFAGNEQSHRNRVTRVNAGRKPSLRWWWTGALLVGVGTSASAYLLLRTFVLLAPERQGAPDICSALFAASCDATLADERSWFLGIPPAGWGLVYFSLTAALVALARFVEGAFESHALIAAFALTVAGTGTGLALVVGALLGREPICPMCVSIHALSLGLCFVLQRAIGRPLREQLGLVRNAWTSLGAGGLAPESTRWQYVGFGSAVLVAAVIFQWVYVESALRRLPPPAHPDRGAAIAAYDATPQHELPVSAADPHRGPIEAPVKLVVFESLQCPHCQRFALTLPRLEREFGDQLLVVFKHYPLSTRCNDRLTLDMQPDACELAWAAEAARLQSRFWQFRDAMLTAGQRASAGSIERAVHGAGIEPTRFEADRRSAAVRERVAEDIELGNELELPGTPATYLDGRLVRPASAELLEILIRHELERGATQAKRSDRAAKHTGRPQPGRRPSLDG